MPLFWGIAITMDGWKVIVSSKSGAGKTRKVWPEIEKLLDVEGIKHSVSFTEYQSHAITLAKEAVLDGYRKILAVGGDGAIHEILNGIFLQDQVPTSEITLGIIPVGSGNDWARLHKIPKEREEAVKILARERVMVQDVARVDAVMDGKPVTRYMMNIGGIGIDSYVCHEYDKAKVLGKFGDALYLECLVKGFFKYKPSRISVKVDDEPYYDGIALSIAFGNGRYSGGGMMQTPDAMPDDGLIDITVVGKINKAAFIKGVKTLYNGEVYTMKEVRHTRGRKISVECTPACYMEVDGEYVGDTPITVEVVPAAIKVLTDNNSFFENK